MTKSVDTVLPRSEVTERIKLGLKKRHRSELIFKSFGLTALTVGFLLVFFLLFDIISKALPAFHQHWVKLEVDYSAANLGYTNGDSFDKLSYRGTLRKSIYNQFPEVKSRKDKRKLNGLYSSNAEFAIKDYLIANPDALNTQQYVWVRLDDDVDVYLKEIENLGEPLIRIDATEAQWVKSLVENDYIEKRFNIEFFTSSDSREPELAGVRGALTGTMLTMLVTLILSFPLGVAAAVYLEEFAPKNRWTDIIEVNINNLAAVPSIIFGLLGLAVIINVFGLPRSAPLVGGIVLTLMTLPTIIIASRASIKAVPPSIREAALGLGASKVQTAFSHVLPMAMPGILTGTIIGMAQALGETAPLLMIGMVAFIVDVPASVTDAATVMPVQIFLWADSPERGFLAKTSAAIMVLLGFLFIMNASAAYLRRRFESN
ncbi:MAG: phosphate ABC transporter permease PstA [Enterobacterales bacterium]|nr:phosphate ABC transporter permease PstA [Enterobacterales bacterium]